MWRPRDRERFIGSYDPEHEMPDPDRDTGDRWQSGAYRHGARDSRFAYRMNPDRFEGRFEGPRRDVDREYDMRWSRDARDLDRGGYGRGGHAEANFGGGGYRDSYGSPYDRDYGRDFQRGGYDRGRDYGRDFGRGYDRGGYGRDFDRGGYGRDFDRGGYGRDYERSFDRGGWDRDYDRSFDRGSHWDRDRIYGSDRGWDHRRR